MKISAIKAVKSSKAVMVKAGSKYRLVGRSRRLDVDLYRIDLGDGRQINVTLGEGVLGTFKPVVRGV